MSWEHLKASLGNAQRGGVAEFAHPIVKLTEDELTRVIGGFDDFGTSASSVTGSASTCDGTKVCCCKEVE